MVPGGWQIAVATTWSSNTTWRAHGGSPISRLICCRLMQLRVVPRIGSCNMFASSVRGTTG